MVDATVFVAVAIGSVLGLLLLSVTLMYCMKRHHDKQQNRELMERRQMEERHRRHLANVRLTQPPPYDSRRQNVLTMVQGPVPVSPPPAYKEQVTPLPPRGGRDGVIVGIGGYGAHESRITADVHYNENHHRQLRQHHSQNRNNNNNISNNNRNNIININNNNNSNQGTTRNNNNNNNNMQNSTSQRAVMTTNASVGAHNASARGSSNMHAQRVRNNHRQQDQHPPRHDPPSYSSLQIRRTEDNNIDNSSISTISMNSSSSHDEPYSNQRTQDTVPNANGPASSRSRAHVTNAINSNNTAESRTALETRRGNVASTNSSSSPSSSSSTHHGQIVTTTTSQHTSRLNTLPEIEDLSLI